MILRSIFCAVAILLCASHPVLSNALPQPDIIVASDGSGDYKTIQAAVASIPATNLDRIVIFVRNGVYHEKIRVDASFITLRGQSRKKTRIEFPQLNDDFTAKPDTLGRAVLNLNHADDFVLENLTVENTANQIGPHAFTIYGTGDRTVIVDCDVLSHGADTVSLWLAERGRYYHARCHFQGSVDFVCPRGWCYLTDCSFYEMKDTAAVWHNGSRNPDMKFVLRNCRFDGAPGWNLARHHADAQFYFLDCWFSRTMTNKPVQRVIYPLGNGPATDADTKRNSELDKVNLWGERCYFYDCHREGGDFAWMTNNLSSATNSPSAREIIPAWTFAGKWNPENKSAPVIQKITSADGIITVTFNETVTVKGHPRLRLRGHHFATFVDGSGTNTLTFDPAGETGQVTALDLNSGAIISTEAAATIRAANTALPHRSK